MFRGSGMGAVDVVTAVIIANVVMYFLTFFTNIGRTHIMGPNFFEQFLPMQPKAVWSGQIWRLFTATYMHANFTHIFVNMLMLYFFGPVLERRWGGRQFLIVYTLGGIAGNILLALGGRIGLIGWDTFGLGASGSIWTLMAAAAVYYPNSELLIYFLFPVRLRTAVTVYFIWFVWNILDKGRNYGGDMCHLAGLLFGVYWAKTGGWAWASGMYGSTGGGFGGFFKRKVGPGFRQTFSGGPKAATFRERVEQRKADAATVDEILAKVYEKGIHSLSPAEKSALNEATARLKEEEKRADQAFKS